VRAGRGWGSTLETDFAAMYTAVGNLIHQINPHLLIICEGLNYAGDLTGVGSHRVQLTEPNKVVYSMLQALMPPRTGPGVG
jgi:hypothetical protein